MVDRRRDLRSLGQIGEVPTFIHDMLYRYFLDHPLRPRAFGIGRWQWLHMDSDVDVGQAVVTQTFG